MKMKKINLLTLLPLTAIATIAPVCACSNEKSTAEKIADAIFDPVEHKVPAQKTKNFKSVLQGFTQEERKNELIYDLFGSCNEPNSFGLTGNSIKELYSENKVAIQSLVTKCSMDEDLKCNFLGYVSFIFTKECEFKDLGIKYEENDYIQVTYNLSGISPRIDPDCSLAYSDPLTDLPTCIGFIKQRYEGGKEKMYFIKEIDTSSYTTSKVFNSKNYIPEQE